jgi:EmrB/QacA subfamily drug resistance transporter
MSEQDRSFGASDRAAWIGLSILCIGQLMIVLDATVVNVALPAIQRELDFSQSSLAWVVNAYLLTFGGLLLFAGRVGDLIGRTRVFLIGLGTFAVSSLVCGVAPTAPLLIAGRFVQGASAAMIAAMVLGIISPMFPEARERTVALTIFSFVGTVGTSLGLVLGGIITQFLNWHWIFFLNVPIGSGALVLGRRFLVKQPGLGFHQSADVLGALLVTVAPMLAVYGLVNAGNSSWGSPRTVASLAGSVVLAGLFIVVEAHARSPLLPLRVLHNRNLASATVIRALQPMSYFGFAFVGVLYLQHVLGYSPLRTGLAFLPMSAIAGCVTLAVMPRLVRVIDLKTLVVIGFILCTIGLFGMVWISVNTGFARGILPTMLLFGAGAGLVSMPAVWIALSEVAAPDAGVASGLINVAVQLGASLAVATLATITVSRTARLLMEHQPIRSALAGGYRVGFFAAAVCSAIGLLAAIVLLPRYRPKTLSDIAEEGSGAVH